MSSSSPDQDLRIVFAGTPSFAAGHLEALLNAGCNVQAVYTQPDRPAGRGKRLQPGPVKTLAQRHELTVLQPASLKSAEAQQQLAQLQPDLLLVVAYGLILPQAVLDIPTYGGVNVHASLLPRWRGAAPIERAMLAGDKETGVTIMQMDAGLDTGAMLHKVVVPIGDELDRDGLEEALLTAGQEALLQVLADLPSFLARAEQQDDSAASYADKLEKHESEIDWAQPADLLARQVRALFGRFPAYTGYRGDRLRIMQAKVLHRTVKAGQPGQILETGRDGIVVACGAGTLSIQALQLPGKKAVAVHELMNSRADYFAVGSCFSSEGL